MNKVCRTCKETKDLLDFSFASSGNQKHNFRNRKKTLKSQCKSCDAAYAREWRKTHTNYTGSGKLTKHGKDRLLASAISTKLIDAKQRIKKHQQQPTDLTIDYLINLIKEQEMCCALSGEKLSLEPKQFNTLSLDKIDANAGYTAGNVQWLCWVVNRAKGEMTTEMFLGMCRTITVRCNDYPEREYG